MVKLEESTSRVLSKETELFRNVLNRKLYVNVTSPQDSYITTSATDGRTIYICGDSKVAKTQGDYDSLLNHEIAHILFKSNRAVSTRLKQRYVREVPQKVIASVYNILEDYRIEDNFVQVFPGAENGFEEIKKTAIKLNADSKTRDASDPVNIILAARLNEKGLLPPNDANASKFYDDVKQEMEELKGTDYIGAYKIAERIIDMTLAYKKYNIPTKIDSSGAKSAPGNINDAAALQQHDEQVRERRQDEREMLKERKANEKAGKPQDLQKEVEEAKARVKERQEAKKLNPYDDEQVLEPRSQTEEEDNEISKKLSEADRTETKDAIKKSKKDLDVELKEIKKILFGTAKQKPSEEDGERYKDKDVLTTLPAEVQKNINENKPYFKETIKPSNKIRNTLETIKSTSTMQARREGRRLNIKNVIRQRFAPRENPILHRDEEPESGKEFWVLMDLSGSMADGDNDKNNGKSKLRIEQEIIGTIYDSVQYDKRIKFRMFGYDSRGGAMRVFEFNRKQLPYLMPDGGTPTASALKYISNKMQKEQDSESKSLILLTDGSPGDDTFAKRGKTGVYEKTYNTVKKMRDSGIDVFSIMVERADNQEEMEEFKKSFGETFKKANGSFFVNMKDSNNLKSTLERVLISQIADRLRE